MDYVPLAGYAIAFSPGSRLTEESTGVDVRREIRYYSLAQLWILMPLAFVVLALREVSVREH